MLGEVQLTQPCPSSVHGPRSLGVLCLQLLVKYRDCLGESSSGHSCLAHRYSPITACAEVATYTQET